MERKMEYLEKTFSIKEEYKGLQGFTGLQPCKSLSTNEVYNISAFTVDSKKKISNCMSVDG